MLDVIRTYCCRAGSQDSLSSPRSSISSDSTHIMAEDESAVRQAILSLIRFYMLKNATVITSTLLNQQLNQQQKQIKNTAESETRTGIC